MQLLTNLFVGALTVHAIGAAAQIIDATTRSNAEQEEWITLFNGQNLTGWTPKIAKHPLGENYANTFHVTDGVLQVSYEGYNGFDEQFGHLFYDRPFSYYKLRLEYRFFGEQAPRSPAAWSKRNSGVMLHSQAASTMLLNQTFPISIEAQFLGGLGDGQPRPTLNVCTPGTEVVYHGSIYPAHCLNSNSKTFDGDQWVRVELLVLGSGLISHSVNGVTALEYSLPQFGGGEAQHVDGAVKKDGELLEAGYIALQSESAPIEFRNIELLNLQGCMDPKARNFKRYFVKSQPTACRYQ